MNIGIIAYRQEPYISANTAIAYILGEEFRKCGMQVVYIGRLQDKKQKEVNDHNGISICYLNDTPKSEWSRTENYLMRVGMNKIALRKDIHTLRTVVRERKLDAVLCITAPNENALIVSEAGLRIPCILLQLDPFYNSNDVENRRLKRAFQKTLSCFRFSFTTELLMDAYRDDFEMTKHVKNMEVAQFPKLVKRTTDENYNREEGIIQLIYVGSLYKPVRDPHILVELRQCLPTDMKVVFCGKCDKDYETVLKKSGVEWKGYCSQEDLSVEIAKSDVLINIGNTVKNQLGSKLIDYIATGKPILNLMQRHECPTQKVLKEYDNQLSIMVSDINTRKNDIIKFIKNSDGKTVPWEEIVKKYFAYTPEYVGHQILEKIAGRSV